MVTKTFLRALRTWRERKLNSACGEFISRKARYDRKEIKIDVVLLTLLYSGLASVSELGSVFILLRYQVTPK